MHIFYTSDTSLCRTECATLCTPLRLHFPWPASSQFCLDSGCRVLCRTHRSVWWLSTGGTALETLPLASLLQQRAWRSPAHHDMTIYQQGLSSSSFQLSTVTTDKSYLELCFLRLRSSSLRVPIRNLQRLIPTLLLWRWGSRMNTG